MSQDAVIGQRSRAIIWRHFDRIIALFKTFTFSFLRFTKREGQF